MMKEFKVNIAYTGTNITKISTIIGEYKKRKNETLILYTPDIINNAPYIKQRDAIIFCNFIVNRAV